MKPYFIFILCVWTPFLVTGQGVSINETGAAPAASAMLDVSSTTKGMLVPRMTTAQRIVIPAPAVGLLVFDLTTNSFWFRTAAAWIELTDDFHGLRDADNDTKVQVEESPDEDIIRFDIGGVEAMVLDESTQGATRLDIGPDHNLFIGRNAGISSFAGWNTFLGYEAGHLNTTGDRSVLVGYRAGKNNLTGIRNVMIGYESGINTTASFNTFLGYHAGVANTTGNSNTFLGHDAGVQNTDGIRNVFAGYNAGHNNEITDENTMVGFSAGYNNEADRNTFYGYEAGMANRTGRYNTIIGGEAAGTNLTGRDMGDGNTIMGYEAAQAANGMLENVMLGYRAGYFNTNGVRNIFIGPNSGFLTTSSYANVAIGPSALRSNLVGNRNVAVGDSSLYSNTVGGNVAVGSKAGMDNTTGGSNTFVGNIAGTNNTTGSDNTFVGAGAGNFNTIGKGNTIIGSDSGNANQDGNYNTIIGLSSGFRNDSGEENVFIGRQAGENNIDGSFNIGIGSRAGNRNNNGLNNIAIGQLALGTAVGNYVPFNNNIGIGLQAGQNTTGNNNIIIGNNSGIGMGGTNSVLLGNNISHYGYNNTFLGSETSADLFGSPIGATAVGYGADITQNYSVILGDADNGLTHVGIGTETPEARLHVSSSSHHLLLCTYNGTNVFRVMNNQDVIVDDVLLVNTSVGKPGYEVSVNGEVVCEELLVENSTGWPDYVFAEDYPLMDMASLREHLADKKHLPGIPPASVVEAEGINVGDMQKRMLEKVEELTLYILQLEERIRELELQRN